MNCYGLIGALLIQAIFLSASQADERLDQGRKLAGQCKICHGSTGIAQIPIAPNIAGEPMQYLVDQLTAFRNGDREHEMMSVVSKSLDDQSIDLLAQWYSSQSLQVNTVNQTADDIGIKNCVECHGIDGLGIEENVPHLAAESVIYLDTQLKAFRSGKRNHDVMSAVAEKMSDEDIRKAAEWYSAITIEVVE